MQSIIRQLRGNPLAKEITVALLIKLLLILGLWYAFFSQPVDRELTDLSVSAVILGHGGPGTPAR
jgi:hypothetical protein